MSLLSPDLSAFVGHEPRMNNLAVPSGPKATYIAGGNAELHKWYSEPIKRLN